MGEIILILGVIALLPVFTWLAKGLSIRSTPRWPVRFFIFVLGALICVLMLKIAKVMFFVAAPVFLLLLILFAGKRKKQQ